MHELGVTFHIMDQLEKVAQENDVERVRKVVLELGEVSTVIESYLQSCWTWAAGNGAPPTMDRTSCWCSACRCMPGRCLLSPDCWMDLGEKTLPVS